MVPPDRYDNISMMNETDKGLRDLGGTHITIGYPDLVVACKAMIDDLIEDDSCCYDMHVDLFLEGLREDIYFVRSGEEGGIIPKTIDNAE